MALSIIAQRCTPSARRTVRAANVQAPKAINMRAKQALLAGLATVALQVAAPVFAFAEESKPNNSGPGLDIVFTKVSSEVQINTGFNFVPDVFRCMGILTSGV